MYTFQTIKSINISFSSVDQQRTLLLLDFNDQKTIRILDKTLVFKSTGIPVVSLGKVSHNCSLCAIQSQI